MVYSKRVFVQSIDDFPDEENPHFDENVQAHSDKPPALPLPLSSLFFSYS
jgi:hypothetical protein